MQSLQSPILETDRIINRIRDLENLSLQEYGHPEHTAFGRFSILEGTKIEWIEVQPGCGLLGKTLRQAELRQKTGVNVIGIIKASDQSQLMAEPDLSIEAHDILVGVGTLEQLKSLESLIYD